MFGSDLAAHIDTNSTFTAGTDLFLNVIRDSTSNRREVFVIETQGQEAVERMGGGALPAMTRPSADVLVRSTRAVGGEGVASSTGARSVAQDLWELLVGIANTSVNGKTYQRITPAHDPYMMGRDGQGRVLFGFRVDALRAATTN